MASAAGPREFQTNVLSVERSFSKKCLSSSVRFALWVFVLLFSACFTRRWGETPQEIAAVEPEWGREGGGHELEKKTKIEMLRRQQEQSPSDWANSPTSWELFD